MNIYDLYLAYEEFLEQMHSNSSGYNYDEKKLSKLDEIINLNKNIHSNKESENITNTMYLDDFVTNDIENSDSDSNSNSDLINDNECFEYNLCNSLKSIIMYIEQLFKKLTGNCFYSKSKLN